MGWRQWSAVPPAHFWVRAHSSFGKPWRGKHIFEWHFTARSRWPQRPDSEPIAANYAAVVDIGPLVVRRDAFLRLGSFDEGFSDPGLGGTGLDFELSLRCWLRGLTVAYYNPAQSRVRFERGSLHKARPGTPMAKIKRTSNNNVNKSTDVWTHVNLVARAYRAYRENVSAEVHRRNLGLELI